MNSDIQLAPQQAIPDQHGANLYLTDPTLDALLAAYLPADLLAHMRPLLEKLGAQAGGQISELAQQADKNPPQLQPRTRTGQDEASIVKHPAWLEMEQLAYGDYAMAALSHRQDVLGWKGPLPPLAKYLLVYLFVQAEFGLMCPVSMTDSLSRTLKKYGSPELVAHYLPQLTSLEPQQRMQGAMFMTEQGAGSDIGATTTVALPEGDHYRIWGDKWFCSNPDAGAALLLARIDGAGPGIKNVSLFFVPRRLADGSLNACRIVRLKDKLGTRSLASGEVTLNGAHAWLMGEPGRGFPQMADMVNNSRLSNGVRSAGMMRRAVSSALFLARERQAFGKKLIEMPLMRRQLLKMLLPCEQARTMMLQTATVLARADHGDKEAYALLRLLTPLIKFRACRDARKVTEDAMEVRGGCGYIEEWHDPRLVRDASLGSIWEGTSNIVALDVRRAIVREHSLEALQPWLEQMIAVSHVDAELQQQFSGLITRVFALARQATDNDGEVLVRQAGSALYHLISAVAMAWEASQINCPTRLALARMVIQHRLLPQDPLAATVPLPIEIETLLLNSSYS